MHSGSLFVFFFCVSLVLCQTFCNRDEQLLISTRFSVIISTSARSLLDSFRLCVWAIAVRCLFAYRKPNFYAPCRIASADVIRNKNNYYDRVFILFSFIFFYFLVYSFLCVHLHCSAGFLVVASVCAVGWRNQPIYIQINKYTHTSTLKLKQWTK